MEGTFFTPFNSFIFKLFFYTISTPFLRGDMWSFIIPRKITALKKAHNINIYGLL
jgi:hypothetical protein